MPIAFNCPHCGHHFEVADSYAGQTGPCAACQQMITIPGETSHFAGSASQDPMPQKKSSTGLIIGILVAAFVGLLGCGGVMAALLLPAVQAAREAARRQQCINNSKIIALCCHNHHDVHKRFPMASTEPVSGVPGAPPGPDQAGFGWTVAVLPFLEEEQLWSDIAQAANNFKPTPGITPFDPVFLEANPNYAVATVQLGILQCPSFSEGKSQSVDTTQSDYEEYPTAGEKRAPALSNYMVTSSSHITLPEGRPGRLGLEPIAGGTAGDGMIVFPTQSNNNPNKGLGMKAASDGTSKTILFCESKEAAYSAWIDGQATWGVGAWPGNAELPDMQKPVDGFLGYAMADTQSKTSLAQAYEARQNPAMFYMDAAQFGGSYDRRFGPSSEHAGGVVVHAFTDGHVAGITPDIDRDVYLRLITRRGGEPVDPKQMQKPF